MNPMITSALTSLLMIALGGVAAKLGLDAATLSTIVGALVSIIVAVGLVIWRAAQRSPNAIIKAAADAIAPTGGVIQTTPEIASAIPNTNVVTKPSP